MDKLRKLAYKLAMAIKVKDIPESWFRNKMFGKDRAQ